MISVILAAHDRPDHVQHTLMSYTKLSYKDWELVFMDSNSTVDIKSIADSYKDKLPIRYIRQDCDPYVCPQKTYLEGFGASLGDFVIVGSADVMVSEPDMLEQFLWQYNDRRITPMCWFLSKQITEQLDMLNWYENSHVLQEQVDFWNDVEVFQTNAQRKANNPWRITNYLTGMSKDRWKWFGLWRDERGFNFSDQDVVQREECMNLPGVELENYCVYHQWHPTWVPKPPMVNPYYIYKNENQARLIEPAQKGP